MRKTFVVEVTPVIDNSGTTQKFLFATEGFATSGTDSPANTVARELLSDPGSIKRELFSGAAVYGPNRPSFGQVILSNHDGVLDDWIGYAISGSRVVVRYGTIGDAYPASWDTVMTAYAESLIVDFNQVRIILRDRLQLLDKPVVTEVFTGTGLEDPESAARKKQIVFGRPGFIPPILVNRNLQIYYVQANAADQRAFLMTNPPNYLVYEGGGSLTFGGYYTSETDGLTNAPAPGQYKIYGPGVDGLTPATTESTGPIYVRLGSPPEYDLRIQTIGYLKETSASGLRTWTFRDLCVRAGMTDLGPLSLSPGSFEKNVGNYLVDGDQTYLDVLTDSCASTFSSYGFDHIDRLFTIDLQDPTEGSDSVVYEFNQHNAKNFVRQPVPGMEAPVWQVVVSSGRTWPSSTRTSLSASERELFTRQPWQTTFSGTSAQAKAINPGAVTASVEITGNNLSTNAAKLAFVQRYIYLFGGRRDLLVLTAEFKPELLDINLHSKVRVKMPRLGCSAGRLFRVVTIEWNLKARTATFGLWGGDAGPLDTVLGAGTSAPGGGTGYTPPPTPNYVLDHFSQFATGSVSSAATAAAQEVLGEFAQYASGTVTNTDPYFSNVAFLLTGTNLVDSGPNALTVTNYGVTVDNSELLFGQPTLRFDGSSRMEVPHSAVLNLTSTYTIDGFVKFERKVPDITGTSTTDEAVHGIVQKRRLDTTEAGTWSLSLAGSNGGAFSDPHTIVFADISGSITVLNLFTALDPPTPPAAGPFDRWIYFQAIVSSNSGTGASDGAIIDTETFSNSLSNTREMVIGVHGATGGHTGTKVGYLKGWLGGLRITVGTARSVENLANRFPTS